jgi:hypothetical protein
VSRYIDINQLLDEVGTSSRSASDPWALSRNSNTGLKMDAHGLSVVADAGATPDTLDQQLSTASAIQSAFSEASVRKTEAQSTGGSSNSSGFLSGLMDFFPLASGIAKLFGFFGGDGDPAPVVTKYQAPPSISFEGAMTGGTGAISSLSYGADGLPRGAGAPPSGNFAGSSYEVTANLAGESLPAGDASTRPAFAIPDAVIAKVQNLVGPELQSLGGARFQAELTGDGATADSASLPQSFSSIQVPMRGEAATPAGSSTGTPTAASAATSPQNILVQVQAMDTQSFMDHSQEIAQAVRQAMLNMNSLNDVILDL